MLKYIFTSKINVKKKKKKSLKRSVLHVHE